MCVGVPQSMCGDQGTTKQSQLLPSAMASMTIFLGPDEVCVCVGGGQFLPKTGDYDL